MIILKYQDIEVDFPSISKWIPFPFNIEVDYFIVLPPHPTTGRRPAAILTHERKTGHCHDIGRFFLLSRDNANTMQEPSTFAAASSTSPGNSPDSRPSLRIRSAREMGWSGAP